jgi:hypothetical protein
LAAQVISEHDDVEMRQFLVELLLSFIGAVLQIWTLSSDVLLIEFGDE